VSYDLFGNWLKVLGNPFFSTRLFGLFPGGRIGIPKAIKSGRACICFFLSFLFSGRLLVVCWSFVGLCAGRLLVSVLIFAIFLNGIDAVFVCRFD
jgi:hypothetical protein